MGLNIPDPLALLVFLGGPLLGLVGIALLALGLRGGMVAGRGRCGDCGHALHDPLPPRCSECGGDLAVPRGIVWGTPVRRPGLVTVGAVVLMAAMAAFMAIPIAAMATVGPNADMRESNRLLNLDAEALAAEIRAADDASRVWTAMEIATISPRFDRAWAVAAVGAAVEVAVREARDESGANSRRGGPLVAQILATDMVDEDELAGILSAALGDVEVAAPRVVRAGEPMPIAVSPIDDRLQRSLADVRIQSVVERVTVGGTELYPHAAADGDAVWETEADEVTVVLPVGRHELIVHTAFRLEIEPVAMQVLGGGTIKTMRCAGRSVRHVVEAVESDVALPRPIADESRRDEVLAGIEVERLSVLRHLDGQRSVVDLGLRVTPVDVAAMDFNVVVEFDDASEAGNPTRITMGRFTRHRRGLRVGAGGFADGPTTIRMTAWAPELDRSVRVAAIDLIPAGRLRSSTDPMFVVDAFGSRQGRARTTVDELWTAPLRLESIAIDRRDLSRAADQEPRP